MWRCRVRTGMSTVMSVPSSSSTLHSRCPFLPTVGESTWSALRIPRPVRRRLRNRINLDIAVSRYSFILSARLTKENYRATTINKSFSTTQLYGSPGLTGPKMTAVVPACINPAHLLQSGQSQPIRLKTELYTKKLNSALQANKRNKYRRRRQYPHWLGSATFTTFPVSVAHFVNCVHLGLSNASFIS